MPYRTVRPVLLLERRLRAYRSTATDRGYSEDEVTKVLGGSFLRVFREVWGGSRVVGTTLPSRPGEYGLGLEGRVLRCPWHGWEFDITTGRSLFAPDERRVKRYEVAVEAVTIEAFEARVEGSFVVVYA